MLFLRITIISLLFIFLKRIKEILCLYLLFLQIPSEEVLTLEFASDVSFDFETIDFLSN